jgi:pilus assembly protein CpaE
MPTESFAVAVITPDRQILEQVTKALEGMQNAANLWALAEYPDPRQLQPIRDAAAGCVVFLDFTDALRARAIASELDRSCPKAVTVAIQSGHCSQDLLDLMHIGVREVLSLPTTVGDVSRALVRALRRLSVVEDAESGGRIFAYLPAKPGCGATTLAIHSVAAAAALTNERTLLIDFDLRLGMTSFLFKLNVQHSVLDALAAGSTLDTDLWERLICRRGLLDILPSAPVEFGKSDSEEGWAGVLELGARQYQTICVDLPGDMREMEIGTLQRAREIFLVCTADIGALHMARRKCDQLRSLDLHHKVSAIVNRAGGRSAIAIADIESILEVPVRFTVAEAEKEITEATRKGVAIEGRTPLALQIEAIARHLIPSLPVLQRSPRARRFIEFFSISPVREKAG